MEALHEVFLDRPVLRAFLATEVRRVMHYIAGQHRLPALPALDAHLDQQIKQAEQVSGGNDGQRR
jgi:hypothetical protein